MAWSVAPGRFLAAFVLQTQVRIFRVTYRIVRNAALGGIILLPLWFFDLIPLDIQV